MFLEGGGADMTDRLRTRLFLLQIEPTCSRCFLNCFRSFCVGETKQSNLYPNSLIYFPRLGNQNGNSTSPGEGERCVHSPGARPPGRKGYLQRRGSWSHSGTGSGGHELTQTVTLLFLDFTSHSETRELRRNNPPPP